MKYPNLRYGNPNELAYHARGIPLKDLARRLRRSERSVMNWLKGTHKMPYWVPELIRLQNMEHEQMRRQMGFETLRPKLGRVSRTGTILPFQEADVKDNKPSQHSENEPTYSNVG